MHVANTTVRTSPCAELPRELIDMIVNYLKGKPSLLVCSLLSRQWRSSVLPKLFHDMCVTGSEPAFPPELDSDEDSSHSDHESKPPIDLDTFYQYLLSDASQNVRPHVKELHLGSDLYKMRISAFELDLILAKLPTVETLSLSDLTITRHSLALTPSGWLTPRTLKALRMVVCYLEPPNWIGSRMPPDHARAQLPDSTRAECCLVELLNLFGDIQTLDIFNSHFTWRAPTHNGLYWDYPDLSVAVGSRIAPTFRVKEMKIHMEVPAGQGDVIELLRNSPNSMDGLQNLTLKQCRPICQKFLVSMGRSLKRLDLTLDSMVSGDDREVRSDDARRIVYYF